MVWKQTCNISGVCLYKIRDPIILFRVGQLEYEDLEITRLKKDADDGVLS